MTLSKAQDELTTLMGMAHQFNMSDSKVCKQVETSDDDDMRAVQQTKQPAWSNITMTDGIVEHVTIADIELCSGY